MNYTPCCQQYFVFWFAHFHTGMHKLPITPVIHSSVITGILSASFPTTMLFQISILFHCDDKSQKLYFNPACIGLFKTVSNHSNKNMVWYEGCWFELVSMLVLSDLLLLPSSSNYKLFALQYKTVRFRKWEPVTAWMFQERITLKEADSKMIDNARTIKKPIRSFLLLCLIVVKKNKTPLLKKSL